MRHLPVHWSEGMFLRPHHFQAADRYWTERLETSEKLDNPYNYGLRSIHISEEALANYQVQVTGCKARMKDGSLVHIEGGQEPDRVDLKEAFAQQSEIRVYLAVPKLSLGRANVGHLGSPDACRYLETRLAIQDETLGGNDQEIAFRALDVRLLLSTQDLSGYEVLPIAQIQRAGETEATPRLDHSYFPPMLAIDAWQPLGIDIVRAIYDILGEKIEVLSQRVVQRGITLASQEPGDLEDLLMLITLNTAYGHLGCLTFAMGVHPFVAYAELCRLVGMLAIFDPARRPPSIPVYDHDDLARIFGWMKRQIELLMNQARRLDYEQRFFVGTERGMQVTIDPKWLHSGWNWYIGVHAENVSERECRDLLRAGNLDWKMGSGQQVDLIFQHGIPGVIQIELPQPPRALPSRQGWIYYEISREGAAWKDVLATQTLGLRFKEQLISNLDTLKGQQKLEVAVQGKRSILRFALFAVPPDQKS
jgi:type VI secretion system protein ImpJ